MIRTVRDGYCCACTDTARTKDATARLARRTKVMACSSRERARASDALRALRGIEGRREPAMPQRGLAEVPATEAAHGLVLVEVHAQRGLIQYPVAEVHRDDLAEHDGADARELEDREAPALPGHGRGGDARHGNRLRRRQLEAHVLDFAHT